MKSFYLSHFTVSPFKTSNELVKRIALLRSALVQGANVPQLYSHAVALLSEGFKQSFLGSDINMEYVLLMVRIYLLVALSWFKQRTAYAKDVNLVCMIKTFFSHQKSIKSCLN